MIHLTIQQLSTYFDGELGPSSALLVRQHFESCAACARKYAGLEAQGTALAKALAAEPDDLFFQGLLGGIEESVRPERPKVSAARPVSGGETPAGPSAEAPARDPLDALIPSPEQWSEWERRTARRRPGHRLRWAIAGAMALAAASAGVVFLRMERVAPPPAATEPGSTGAVTAAAPSSPAAPDAAETDPRGRESAAPTARAAPAPTSEEPASPPAASEEGGSGADSGESDFEPVAIPADEALAGIPRAGSRERAGRAAAPAPGTVRIMPGGPEPRTAPAAGAPTAADYDAAAARWQEALPSLRGDEYRQARFRLAEALYKAWRLAPSDDRAARAEGSIRAYLVTAPGSTERDEASRWLSHLEDSGYR